jgi:WD40 repeat protein
VGGSETRERTSLKGTGTIHALAVSNDSRFLASGGQEGAVRLWGLGKLWHSEQAVLPGHYGSVASLAFSSDGKMLASGGSDAAIIVWDLTSSESQRRPKAILEGHTSTVRLLLFPRGETNKLLSVSDRGRAILWDLTSNRQDREWPAPAMMVCGIATTFDGRYLAVGRNDGAVAVFRQYPKRS